MKIVEFPDPTLWPSLLQRPAQDLAPFRTAVLPILEAVKNEGDAALRRFALQFEKQVPAQLAISDADWAAAESQVPAALQTAIRQAYANIRAFHAQQIEPPLRVETMPGIVCERKSVPIERIGLYIPGGTAPLFSTVLMLGVPAQLAGCEQIVLCSPPQKNGSIHPAVLFAARLCGIRQVFQVGGAQAIAAMAFGTESIPQVYKIFGPGNPWVTAAKQLVALDGVAIDMPAGPSEVCVIADASANPNFIAADLLSQAEHGADSQVLFLTDDKSLIYKVQQALETQLATLPRADVAREALNNSTAILTENVATALSIANVYAPEHLILQTDNPQRWQPFIRNAGSVFMGHFTPESAGDYASGTNHTLPTGGYARSYSGVSVDSFVKKITFQQITKAGLEALAPTIVAMAQAEGLDAHAQAVICRI